MRLTSFSFLLASVSACLVASGERQTFAMGTALRVQVDGVGAEGVEALLVEVERLEARVSSWRPGTVFSRLNGEGGRPVPLEADLLDLLAWAKGLSRETGGTFSPTLLPLAKAWGLRSGGRVPTEAEREAALKRCALDTLVLGEGEAWFAVAGGGIDEGGFLKGYALDRLVARARALRLGTGWADFGGQIIAWGAPREVEVAVPSRRQEPMFRITIVNASLSVSGCSERGRHILDPRSGNPSADWGAVAVVAPEGLVADALSTALFVMGPHAGPAWAESRGLAAAFLPHRGAATYTAAFRALNPTPVVSKESQ